MDCPSQILIFLLLFVHNAQIQVPFYFKHNQGQSFKNSKIGLINIFLIFSSFSSLPMGFDYFSPVVPDILIWALFDPVLQ